MLISIIYSNLAKAQCSASFNFIDNGGGNFSFINTSIAGAGAGYSWSFGDGNVSTLENPTHTYSTTGTYTVSMEVRDSLCLDSALTTITVVINNPCTVNPLFSYVDNGNGDFTFTDLSTTNSGGLMYGMWSFGDGANGYTYPNNTSVSHTYTTNGVYVVVLQAYDSLDNCFEYYTQTIVVSGLNAPIISCNAAYVVYRDSINPNTFIVVNSSTGTNLTYFWDFGDGNTSTMEYPNYTYTASGPFQLCLTVADSLGCTSTYCDSISGSGIVWKQGGFTINVISPESTLSINEEAVNTSELSLYPNPVNEILNIKFNLIKESKVELYVTDITGKVVVTIANKENQIGIQKYLWNTGGFQNGVYFLNIKTGSSIQTNKILINK